MVVTALMLKSGLHLKPQPGDHRVRATIKSSMWALKVASHASWEGIFPDGDFLNGTVPWCFVARAYRLPPCLRT